MVYGLWAGDEPFNGRGRIGVQAWRDQPGVQGIGFGGPPVVGVVEGAWALRASSRTLGTPEFHARAIARIPSVTGMEFGDWFRWFESGPSFLRCNERARWLSEEHGLSHGYASAIVHEYELRRRLAACPSTPLLVP